MTKKRKELRLGFCLMMPGVAGHCTPWNSWGSKVSISVHRMGSAILRVCAMQTFPWVRLGTKGRTYQRNSSELPSTILHVPCATSPFYTICTSVGHLFSLRSYVHFFHPYCLCVIDPSLPCTYSGSRLFKRGWGRKRREKCKTRVTKIRGRCYCTLEEIAPLDRGEDSSSIEAVRNVVCETPCSCYSTLVTQSIFRICVYLTTGCKSSLWVYLSSHLLRVW